MKERCWEDATFERETSANEQKKLGLFGLGMDSSFGIAKEAR
jgi:hypothetical protein